MARMVSFIGACITAIVVWVTSCVIPSHANPEPPKQGWEICNKTSYIIDMATGHPNARGVTIKGWTRLKPGRCAQAHTSTLTPGIHYLFGRSARVHLGGQRFWSGNTRFCVDPDNSFLLTATPDCPGADGKTHKFQAVLIEDSQYWQTNLVETRTLTLERAGKAGIQRLLDDAGVYSGNIDGYIGRKTRAAITRFLNTKGLAADMSDDDLVSILEQAAIEHAQTIGLTFCNRTGQLVWSAMARRRDDTWESRGWWVLESGTCARVIDSPLLPANVFVYAEMETADGTLHILKNGTDPFCVSGSKFAITGRESCEAAAWQTRSFVATDTPKNGKLVFEFLESDFHGISDGDQLR